MRGPGRAGTIRTSRTGDGGAAGLCLRHVARMRRSCGDYPANGDGGQQLQSFAHLVETERIGFFFKCSQIGSRGRLTLEVTRVCF